MEVFDSLTFDLWINNLLLYEDTKQKVKAFDILIYILDNFKIPFIAKACANIAEMPILKSSLFDINLLSFILNLNKL